MQLRNACLRLTLMKVSHSSKKFDCTMVHLRIYTRSAAGLKHMFFIYIYIGFQVASVLSRVHYER